MGLLSGILTYAVEAGIIESNPAHGVRKPKDNVRKRRLLEAEYRILGGMLREAAKQEKYTTIADIVRQIALTGCRRGEMIELKWTEADTETSCLRLEDSKEGESIRPIGLPVVDYFERRRTEHVGTYVFPGQGEDNALGSFPNHWKHMFEDSPLSDITPNVLRHSFASIANDLGFTEVTIAALVGHAKGSVTSKYIHTLDTALIMAADTISGYIQGLLDGIEYLASPIDDLRRLHGQGSAGTKPAGVGDRDRKRWSACSSHGPKKNWDAQAEPSAKCTGALES